MSDKPGERIGRRRFLKRGVNVLPALAVVGLAVVAAPPARADDCVGCSDTCRGCSGDCEGICNGDCAGSCRGTCSATCRDGGEG